MNRIFFSLAIAIIISSCGNSSSENGGGREYTNDPVYKKGVALVGKNKCFSCHAINETITGPAYVTIGEKYANASDSLVGILGNKIISGGTGVWGSAIMIPHPGVSQEDAEAMVRYILLLGKKSK